MPSREPPVAELTTLLCRGLSRLAIAAQGGDDRLDSLLAELRHYLRGDLHDVAQLGRLVELIEQRIRELDGADPVAELQRALSQLATSLQALPAAEAELGELPARLASARLTELGTLAAQLATCQQRLLSSLQAPLLDPSAPGVSPLGRWTRWFGRGADTAASISPAPAAPQAELYSHLQRLLLELLRQLEPPPLAAANHRRAQTRLERGLDDRCLGSVLEDICQVVVAAIEHDRGEFQQFLLMLNQRLAAAHTALAATRAAGRERQTSGDELQRAVAAEVQAMEAGLAGAASLAGLKAEVTQRLNAIVSSLETHRSSESAREAALQQQLDQLGAQVEQMAAESVRIEQRMEAQRRLALLDTLTQLPNRQAYEEQLQAEWARSRRHGRALTLALCDVDNFKAINDSFGHLAGDKVLRVIARALRTRLRRSDLCARYGGEEFVLLLPETDPAGALQILEEIRLAVAACPFRFRDQPVAITLSAGIAAAAASDSPEQLFRRADAALYQAKRAGRNRCVVAAAPAAAAVAQEPI